MYLTSLGLMMSPVAAQGALDDFAGFQGLFHRHLHVLDPVQAVQRRHRKTSTPLMAEIRMNSFTRVVG